MAFKIPEGAASCPDDPEALFRDLRKRTIPGLLSHQADLIRTYVRDHTETADVALQLPTGSGKTLVGLLIAEWRRRKFRQRCVYLCPTKQLVNQVVDQAVTKYGLDVLGFTGSKSNYPAGSKARWTSGDVVGVTNYSSLFNVNPFFTDAGLVVLDDAHAAENYISSHWSVTLNQWNPDHKATFDSLAGFLRSFLPLADRGKIGHPNSTSAAGWVDVVPIVRLHSRLEELQSLLDEHTEGTSLSYSWSTIRGSLEACSIYCSPNSLLIRPLIPPTSTHAPFASPKQRLYMSATLGAGGDLERITGRPSIARVEIPAGWDKQGTGRRFFLFPERSLESEATQSVLRDLIITSGRSLYLTPDDQQATRVRERLAALPSVKLFTAGDIERSKDRFIDEDLAVAVVANRYDGIDLVDDECRLLILDGLPRGTNLQERFLTVRVGAGILLDDRILTRVVQGFGRCTRSATDYSAVVVLGDDLQTYLMKPDQRGFFHPEMQAEIEFGLEQSKDSSTEEMKTLATLFWSQSPEWEAADNAIVSIRSGLLKHQLRCTADLKSTVADEVKYQEYAWHGDHLRALEQCRHVLGKLTHSELRGYRALWSYLAGTSAWLAEASGLLNAGKATAREYFDQARDAVVGLRFLIGLGADEEDSRVAEDSSSVMQLVERMEQQIAGLGTAHNRGFDAAERTIRDALWQSDDGELFERGHEQLGKLLGYDVGNGHGSAEPDPWWLVDSGFGFVFEDNAAAKSHSPLGANKARQAASHATWIRARNLVEPEAELVLVLITPKTKAEKNALPHLEAVRYWLLEDFCEWADQALHAVRDLRRVFPGEGDLTWRAQAAEALRRNAIAPTELDNLLSRTAAEALQAE